MSAIDDVDKMMSDYREKVLASRTRFQRFVDRFTMVPMPTYFILMFLGVFSTGTRLTSLDLSLRSCAMLSSPNFLAGFQKSILIHLWFIPPTPTIWNPALMTPGATSVLVGFSLFLVYFVSRRLAYNQIYYIDISFLTFFLIGILLLLAAPRLFATLYYYYPATLVFGLLAIPSFISIIAGKPFTLQHVERVYPQVIKELDIYKKIHYRVATFFVLVFIINSAVFYFRFYLPTASPVFTALFFMPFYFLILAWAFMTHFVGWYRRRVLKTPLQKPATSLPSLVKIGGALLIIYGQLTFIVGLWMSTSITFSALSYILAIILMLSGFGVILVKKWGWYLAISGLFSHIGLYWLTWIATTYSLTDWLASVGNFFVTLSLYPPSDNLLFLALIFSSVSSIFLCYLFPKRNYYLL
ncbi:MAG: hypothetical protein ACUVXA_11475 [Candidatus Jordarchaeum sp.]|uniref:hypothetical protein n=1 Tax=Candidatus Jordarchaeum sp. TaxID=2823881 RepID=UPI00404B0DCA